MASRSASARPTAVGEGDQMLRAPSLYKIALEILDKETPLSRKITLVEVGLAIIIIRSETMLRASISDEALNIPHLKEIERREGVKTPANLGDIKRWARELLEKIRWAGLSDPYNTIYNIGVILAAISFVQGSSMEEA